MAARAENEQVRARSRSDGDLRQGRAQCRPDDDVLTAHRQRRRERSDVGNRERHGSAKAHDGRALADDWGGRNASVYARPVAASQVADGPTGRAVRKLRMPARHSRVIDRRTQNGLTPEDKRVPIEDKGRTGGAAGREYDDDAGGRSMSMVWGSRLFQRVDGHGALDCSAIGAPPKRGLRRAMVAGWDRPPGTTFVPSCGGASDYVAAQADQGRRAINSAGVRGQCPTSMRADCAACSRN